MTAIIAHIALYLSPAWYLGTTKSARAWDKWRTSKLARRISDAGSDYDTHHSMRSLSVAKLKGSAGQKQQSVSANEEHGVVHSLRPALTEATVSWH